MYIHKIFNFIRSVFGYCPYCIAGRQVVNKITKKPTVKKIDLPRNDEAYYWGKIKTGRNIALIGVFCPIFWTSLFMGADRSTILFNAFHSSIFVCIGGIYSLANYVILRRLRMYTRE
ncbi:hypothetical protein [Sinanaerobacter chloroacetimidivorans]|uniref:Uncharacterized protein n=1 Tax=Sinanaerobacter chloroacetimidivorans TaxID=2818044 RepID=A0A8J8B3Q9_9FIRM|nr:hypothetical protein [Sinanaerobacter chloroacetimidivorans]MBR0598570.1 hypothetical protein [Sinanaerobacter chloroacetimidivorans]